MSSLNKPSKKGYFRQREYSSPLKKKGSTIYTHRVIKEKQLTELNGIPTFIHSSLIVHHKDFDTLNNDPQNLQVLTKSEHDRIHADKRFKDMSNRICSKCNSNKTYLRKDNGWAIWYDDKNGGWLCKKCSMLCNYHKKKVINDVIKPIVGV